ncbi:hypothetical protein [Micromonospora echinofusca]|uniref:Uncharacterized protein n=1 Tax=Micromonospora echinofusca TaxID=47858 RepID=A0ABS3VMV4_MICEH|nr:hypothetical protein [Micromonospora echinofusca]MBO4205884.1 hypothetical protein [Micromonospora echinofusca]
MANGETSERRTRLDWRGRLSGVALGAAGGMGVNVLSNDFEYWGAAAAAAAGAVLATITWLRGLPPRAPLVRYTTRTLLALALVGAVVAGLDDVAWNVQATLNAAGLDLLAWTGYATLAAAALTIVAVLIVNTAQAVKILYGAALIGIGMVLISSGTRFLELGHPDELMAEEYALAGVVLIGSGAALIGGGIMHLTISHALAGVVLVVGGMAVIGGGITLLVEGGFSLRGVMVIGGGMALIGGGIMHLTISHALAGVVLVVAGMAVIGGGITLLVEGGFSLDGVMVIGGGMALIGGGVMLARSHTLRGVMGLGIGVALIGIGILFLVGGDGLFGAVVIGGGMALTGGGIMHLTREPDFMKRLQGWAVTLTRDPRDAAPVDLPRTGTNAAAMPNGMENKSMARPEGTERQAPEPPPEANHSRRPTRPLGGPP